jgi:hypothetical protein
LTSIDLRGELLTQGNNFEVPQDSKRVAVATASERVHVGKVACGNSRTKNIMKVYHNLLGFAVQPDALVSQLNLISQEWENANETRDSSQGIKTCGRLSLGNVAGVSTGQKTLAKAAKKLSGLCVGIQMKREITS